MSLRLQPRSVRVRLTLWYLAGLAGVLAAYAAIVFLFVNHAFLEALDNELYADVDRGLNTIDEWKASGIDWREGHGRLDPDDASLWLRVLDGRGRVLFRSPAAQRLPLEQAAPMPMDGGPEAHSAAAAGGQSLRVLTIAVDVANEPLTIQVARSETALHHELNELLLILIVVAPVGIGLAGVGGYALARRALAPVDRMSERARTITADRLADRLPIENARDELGRLAATFNDLLTRLQSSFDRMRQFTADASHELRTPLTALRSVGEDGLRERRDADGYRDVIGSMLEEADRLSQLVDTLLTLSRADTGGETLPREPVEIGALVRQVVATLSVLAEEKGQSIEVEGDVDVVEANQMALRQALTNVVDNAIKYSPAGRRIRVRLKTVPAGDVSVEVVDEGPGISPEHRARIFERFYRVDRARSRARGGTGLGLAVARWAVDAQGGQLDYDEAPGGGSLFRITLRARRPSSS